MGLEWVVVVLLIASTGGQFVQENCPIYFRYVNDAFGGIQGEITLSSLQPGTNRIDARFWQEGNSDASSVGGLNPYPDDDAIRLGRGPFKFRVAFRASPPKLTRLSYNDQLLCSASENAGGGSVSYHNRFYEKFLTEPFPSPAFQTFPRDDFDVGVQTVQFPSSRGRDVLPGFTQTWRTSTDRRPTFRQPQFTTQAPTFWQPPEPRQPATFGPPPIATNPPATMAPPQRFDPRSTASPITCGREGSLIPFIVRGTEYPRGQYPWLAALYHKVSRSLTFRCGGSLISASIVVSAAHCVYRMSEDSVVIGLGRYDLDNYGEEGAETRNVKQLLWHPDYSTRSVPDADVALITIDRPVKFNDIIAPICLWTAEASSTVSTSGFIAGWGRDDDSKDKGRTQYPRVVEADIASPTVCASTWRIPMLLSERTLCAGNRDGSGPCVGDSGGGLMVKQGDRWLLRGIVSLGERGPVDKCQLEQYVLYCDLSKHMDWINDNIR
ncbi:CLIP domain-containing serine protease B15 [Drosophila takahashii]|uniref:CLIP domain-containing serine protease B15 n=1 Tax=Drosophila takahashii TaxID=29030 RepID=UPI001CF8A189|nr:putative serine protease 42 [Drosophila takahashii]